MKNIVIVLLVMILIFTQGCIHSSLINTSSSIEEDIVFFPNGEYCHTLFDGCKIYRYSGEQFCLTYKNTDIVEGAFYKYGVYNDRYVAIHFFKLNNNYVANNNNLICFNGDFFDIEENSFILFDSRENNIEKFTSISKFNDFIEKHSINLKQWYYGADALSNKIELSENCYIEDAGKYRGQILFINSSPLLEGVISEYATIDNNHIAIVFKDVALDYGPEFTNITNQNLHYEIYSSNSKYRIGLLSYDIEYSGIVVVNISNGCISEYASKNELKTFFSNENYDWTKI